jgi:endonuclease/exonuclease/phosphatase (EEP) superfamily protein YafD
MWHVLLGALSAICLASSLIPLMPFPHGMVRMFDFGRLQVVAVSTITLALVGMLLPQGWTALTFTVMLVSAIVIQATRIAPFTPLWRIQSARYRGDTRNAATVTLLTCNVKQGNRDFDKVTALLKTLDPDIAVFMETDDVWTDALKPALSHYTEVMEYPQDNSYGMILASKFNFAERSIRFHTNEEIPSFDCLVNHPLGRQFRLIALHPEPPVPIDDTIGRDAEILTVGKIAQNESLPVIVTGDLNDVAWSSTTRRFLRISRLLDPRQGRGMFNSFDARYPFLRWPLDHIFHSKDFELITIARQPFVGSDHFPMYYSLALVEHDHNAPPAAPSKSDFDEADELISIEENRDRSPAGTDWEG